MGGVADVLDKSMHIGSFGLIKRGTLSDSFEPPDTSDMDAMYAAQARETEKNIKALKQQQFEAERNYNPGGVRSGGGQTTTSTPTLARFRPQAESTESLFE